MAKIESDSDSLQSEEFAAQPSIIELEKPKFLDLVVPDVVESKIEILPDDNPPTVELKTDMIAGLTLLYLY